MNKTSLTLISSIIVLCMSCEQRETSLLWTQTFFQMGSQSSPRCVDLNSDGTLDIVMGAGRGENDAIAQGVIALDGKDGSLLWSVPAQASIVGSPIWQDVTGDRVPDIFIGGRNRSLMGINGQTGELLWSYEFIFDDHPTLQYARYNFYNGTWVPDQNDDGLQDLLIINGGNWNAAPNDLADRFPGVLMLVDPANGEILASDTMPDGKESYMSPVAYQENDTTHILFGTGGETVGGSLYLCTLDQLFNGELHNSRLLVNDPNHGFIGPPVMVDLDGDHVLDIVAASHGGLVWALKGKLYTPLWQHHFSNMEISNSFAIGYFTGDDIPDVAVTMSEGTWPSYSYAHHVAIDGSNGTIIYHDSSTCFSLSSPIAADLTGDGRDEVLLSTNLYDCNIKFNPDTLAPPLMANELTIINYRNGRRQTLDRTDRFMNIFSTPWVGDVDDDGFIDVVYTQFYNPTDIRRFLGMQIKRVSTSVKQTSPIPWGAYQGSTGDGVENLSIED